MFDNNYFAHTCPKYGSPFEMMTDFEISYFSVAENITVGYPTSEDVVNGRMNSLGHRNNILGESYTHIGIGLKCSSENKKNDFTNFSVKSFLIAVI